MSMENNSKPQAVFWYRRDLRHYDNHGFFQALTSGQSVRPIFIFDKDILDDLEPDDRRVVFILDALEQLKEKLQESGGDLHVYYGKPAAIFTKLIENYSISAVYANHDYEPYAKA